MRITLSSFEMTTFKQDIQQSVDKATTYVDFKIGDVSIEMFVANKDLEHVFGELTRACAAVETIKNTLDLSPAELAPAGVSEQDDEVPF